MSVRFIACTSRVAAGALSIALLSAAHLPALGQDAPQASPRPAPQASATPASGFKSGLIITPEDHYMRVKEAEVPFGGQLKPQADLADKLPPPGFQGQELSCAAWSLAYALRSYEEAARRAWPLVKDKRIVKEHVFSPAFLYNSIVNGKDDGLDLETGFNWLASNGVVPLSVMDYRDGDLSAPPPSAARVARQYRIARGERVALDFNAVRAHLNAGRPVVLGAFVDDSFMTLPPGEIYNSYASDDAQTTPHAMVIVGYDDTVVVPGGGLGAFKVMNSWGPSWSDQGFGWISYRFFKKIAKQLWIAVPRLESYGSTLSLQEVENQITFSVAKPQFDKNPVLGDILYVSGTLTAPPDSTGELKVVVRIYEDLGKGKTGTLIAAQDVQDFSDYVDATGAVAGRSDSIQIPSTGLVAKPWTAIVPIGALAVQRGRTFANGVAIGSTVTHHLLLQPVLYLNEISVTQLPPQPIPLFL